MLASLEVSADAGSAWTQALIALLPALGLCAMRTWRGTVLARLVAFEMASAVGWLMLAFTSFAFDQPSFIDLPLALLILSLPGTLLFAHFLERWL